MAGRVRSGREVFMIPESFEQKTIKGVTPRLTVTDLPPPPVDKMGWPWTVGGPTLPETLPNGTPWPRISIVTPSFGQAEYIEETIRSVLLQGYPNLEYLIFDGGSTDGSVEIIRKYEPWLTYWVSKTDRGQAHAINQGMLQATGTIGAWLNSDDFYFPSTLATVAEAMHEHFDSVAVYGRARWVSSDGRKLGEHLYGPYDRHYLLEQADSVPQASAFFRRQAFIEVGCLDENLHYALDYDLWLKLDTMGPFYALPIVLSCLHVYPGAKTSSGNQRLFREVRDVVKRHGRSDLPLGFAKWLVSIHVPLAFSLYLRGEAEAAQRELAFVIEQVPSWYSSARLASAVAERAWIRMGGLFGGVDTALQFVDWVCNHLPNAIATPNDVRRNAQAMLHTNLAFVSQIKGDRRGVYRHLYEAITRQPENLRNRGLWATLARTALHIPDSLSKTHGQLNATLVKQYLFQWLAAHQAPTFGLNHEGAKDKSGEGVLASHCYVTLSLSLLGEVKAIPSEQLVALQRYLLKCQQDQTSLFEDSAQVGTLAGFGLATLPVEQWEATYLTISTLKSLGVTYSYPLSFLSPFVSKAYLLRWLTDLNWLNAISAMHQIATLVFCLIEDGKRLSDERYMEAAHWALDWLDEHQSAETGGWEMNWKQHSDGLLVFTRMLPIYFSLGRHIRYKERVIDYALLAQQFNGLFSTSADDGAQFDLSAVDVLCKLSLLTDYRASDVHDALMYAFDALYKTSFGKGGYYEPPSHEFGLANDDLRNIWFRLMALALIDVRFPGTFNCGFKWNFLDAAATGWHDADKIRALINYST